jgi:hypothetical protein
MDIRETLATIDGRICELKALQAAIAREVSNPASASTERTLQFANRQLSTALGCVEQAAISVERCLNRLNNKLAGQG